MKTACLICFVCDPYLAVFQKNIYLKYWKDEVDEVLVNVNGINEQLKDFIFDLWQDDKVKVVQKERMMRQGTAFDLLYPHVSKDIDVVMTQDSDNFIYKKGVITEFVDKIASGEVDAFGSSGNHAYPPTVSRAIVAKYGTVRFNPFMTYWRKSILDQIEDLSWTSYGYEKGDSFEPVGTFEMKGHMEVMAKLSLEFFHLTKKYKIIPQAEFEKYVHIGGVSSIFRRFFHSVEGGDKNYIRAKGSRINIYYLLWDYIFWKYTKDRVPFPEYNKEMLRLIKEELKLHEGSTISDLEEVLERNKFLYPGLL